MLTLVYFILILGLIILVHEFGHFIFAKMFGVYVYEFSIGMGPKVWKKKSKKSETVYSLGAIPIGGYVQLAGEEIDDDEKVPKNKKMYSKKIWQRFLIMFFGAGNNFILAILLLFMFGLIFGAPKMDSIITDVTKDYPAYESGIVANDKILEINGKKTPTLDDAQLYLTLAVNKNNKTTTFKIEKENGNVVTYKITPKKEKLDGKETYMYGLTFEQKSERGFIKSIVYSFKKLGALFRQMTVTLKELFTGGIGVKNLSGPVGIYSIVGQTSKNGIASVIQLIVLLSVNVGFINLIPFPAFDGGRILFLIIEKIKGSPVPAKIENIIHSIGFILLILLLLYVTFNDILRII